jgi:cytochrome-b5 reductase
MSKILSKANIGTKFFIGPPKLTVPSYFFNDITNATAYACIAGGTGITPFIQMIKLLENKLSIGEKAPKLTLLYSNKKEEDILLKAELMEYVKKLGDHFKVIFTLTREDPKNFSEQSPYLFGRVNADTIERFLSPKLHTHIFVSGPEGMWDTLLPILIEKGYDKSSCTELEA